ncbi:hypothetical protein LSAT2_011820 [Lamellibrachia satsuma]|nr:hypothetical protein LSAT2_011820 [Lamellibrachia satsuma]
MAKGQNVTGMYEKKQQSNYSFITSKVNRQPRMDQLSGIVPQSRICQPSGTMPLSRTVQNSGTMLGRSKGMPVTPRGVRPQQGEIIAMSPVAGHQSWGSPSKPPLPKSDFSGSFYTRASQPVQVECIHQ